MNTNCLSPDRHERDHTPPLAEDGRPEPDPNDAVNTPNSNPPRLGRLFIITLIALAAALVFGLIPRLRERHVVASDTRELLQPSVQVVSPTPAKAGTPLVLSGELKPVTEASIHARVNGYIRRWLVDLGAHVEAGQLLAELDTPDTNRELSQAQAQLGQAEAARDLAISTAKRWKEMLLAKTVSAQEADEKSSDLELKKATVEAARANVERLQEISRFARITAPFAGTITIRQVDVGQLITAGEGQELYRLAQTDKLRVFVRVPQNYAHGTSIGQTAELILPEQPGRKFEAKVVRTAGALDAATRTLLTELEVDNSSGEILAGSYAQVRLADARPNATLTLPSNTLIFRGEGPQVVVVENGRLASRQVKIGRDFGSSVEVEAGVAANEQVVVNPSDSLTDGMVVRVGATK
jgi:RND family efflux transporter MFP subunit